MRLLSQTDEEDMGMTYEELTLYGRLRKIYRLGPVSMFVRLVQTWGDRLRPSQVTSWNRRGEEGEWNRRAEDGRGGWK